MEESTSVIDSSKLTIDEHESGQPASLSPDLAPKTPKTAKTTTATEEIRKEPTHPKLHHHHHRRAVVSTPSKAEPALSFWDRRLLHRLQEVRADLLQRFPADNVSRIRTLLKHLSLFHPHDVTQLQVLLNTIKPNACVEASCSAEALDRMVINIGVIVVQNIKGAINELTTGCSTESSSFVEKRTFGSTRLRLITGELDPLFEDPSMKESLTYRQEISFLWADPLLLFSAQILMLMFTLLCWTCWSRGESVVGVAQSVWRGEFDANRAEELGFLVDISKFGSSLLYVCLVWGLLHIVIAWIMCDSLMAQDTWIFKVVHLVLPIILGVVTSWVGQAKGLIVFYMPQLVCAFVMSVYYRYSSVLMPAITSKVALIGLYLINSQLLYKLILPVPTDNRIDIPTDSDIFSSQSSLLMACRWLSFVISAGWSIMFNHDRRLAGTLEDIGKADYKIRHKFHGGIIALIFLLPCGILIFLMHFAVCLLVGICRMLQYCFADDEVSRKKISENYYEITYQPGLTEERQEIACAKLQKRCKTLSQSMEVFMRFFFFQETNRPGSAALSNFGIC